MGPPFRRRYNRLPADCYRAAGHIHFTLCTHNRQPLFRARRTIAATRQILFTTFIEPIRVDAFCFMPDHLHLLISSDGGIDARAPLVRFKQAAAWAYRRRTGMRLWQPRFHDHVLRHDDALLATIEYILANPVRRGLCEDWREWVWSWSRWHPQDASPR